MRNQRFSPYEILLFVLAVGGCYLMGGSSVSAKPPALCKGNVVPEQFERKVALVSREDSVTPGDYVYTRLFNGLNRRIGLGTRYLQRYVDGQWERVMLPPRPDGAEPIYPPAVRGTLAAHSAGECRSFKVELDQPLGRYRVVNEVYIDRRPGAKPRARTVEFRIR